MQAQYKELKSQFDMTAGTSLEALILKRVDEIPQITQIAYLYLKDRLIDLTKLAAFMGLIEILRELSNLRLYTVFSNQCHRAPVSTSKIVHSLGT
jgi:hypothetical protein